MRATVEGRIATVEHVVGNVFRARIFPVPHEGRTVQIVYISELRQAKYELPLQFANRIKRLSCSLQVILLNVNIFIFIFF